jgi:hypothetical protein
MVGIYSKLKTYFGKLGDGATKMAYDYGLPLVSKIGKFANSPFVQGLASRAAPALDSFVPGLGTAVSKGLPFVSRFGDMAQSAIDYHRPPAFANAKSSARSRKGRIGLARGAGLAKRPDDLHERVQLKALMPADDESIEEDFNVAVPSSVDEAD